MKQLPQCVKPQPLLEAAAVAAAVAVAAAAVVVTGTGQGQVSSGARTLFGASETGPAYVESIVWCHLVHRQ